MLEAGEDLPVDLRDRAIYYVGRRRGRRRGGGPAGPTTATRMDKFLEPILSRTGLLVMVGKAEGARPRSRPSPATVRPT